MSEKNSRVNIKSILIKQVLSSSNPYEEMKFIKITNNLRKRLLGQQSNNSTAITNNHSNTRLNFSVIKRDITLPRLNSHRNIKTKDILKQTTSDKLQKELQERNLYKKFLKGKLLKLIRNSIIIDKEKLEIMQRFKNQKNIHNPNEMVRMKKKVDVITQKNPDLLNEKKYVNRYEDTYVTPDELLSRNFSENDLNIIKSNPTYFMLDAELFGEVFVQQKKLFQTIEEEEMIKKDIKDKKKLKEVNKFGTQFVKIFNDEYRRNSLNRNYFQTIKEMYNNYKY